MRRPIIAGNWKMNLNRQQSVELASALGRVASDSVAEVLVCPPFVYLDGVSSAVEGTAVKVGAQDVYFEEKGAFTGEISSLMLTDLGCTYVILGHSERRHVMGETDEVVNLKVKTALAGGLTPIVCVGETLDERENGQTMDVVRRQISGSLSDLTTTELEQIVIAYEPVWAIGTGKTATPEQAQEVHADLRKILSDGYNSESANSVRILYGGSVKPNNALSLMSQPDIDGALVGGASLNADHFVEIINATGAPSAN